jgi:septum formation topological specificity factor MinE
MIDRLIKSVTRKFRPTPSEPSEAEHGAGRLRLLIKDERKSATTGAINAIKSDMLRVIEHRTGVTPTFLIVETENQPGHKTITLEFNIPARLPDATAAPTTPANGENTAPPPHRTSKNKNSPAGAGKPKTKRRKTAPKTTKIPESLIQS